MKNIYLFWLLFLIFPISVLSQADKKAEEEVGIIEHLDRIVPSTIKVVNEQGDTVFLKSLIDKPTVLNLVYYRCPGICTPLMDGLASLVSKSDLKIGSEYQILTVSFDPREGIELAKIKKNNYLKLVKQEDAKTGWKFFVADSANVANITDFFGFRYTKTGNDFLHAAAILVLSPNGKITRYHYGTFFQPFEFRMSVIEASKEISQPTINRILQYCFKYDAQGKKYVLNVTRVSATFIIVIALFLFLYLVGKPILAKRKAK